MPFYDFGQDLGEKVELNGFSGFWMTNAGTIVALRLRS